MKQYRTNETGENDMHRLVVGYIFDLEMNQVILIKKIKPEFMAGKLNGVGGKVEPGEDYLEAMRRECKEETGLDIYSWNKVCKMVGLDWKMIVYYSLHNNLLEAKQMEEEEVGVYDVWRLFDCELMHDVQWIVHLAKDHGKIQLPLVGIINTEYRFAPSDEE